MKKAFLEASEWFGFADNSKWTILCRSHGIEKAAGIELHPIC